MRALPVSRHLPGKRSLIDAFGPWIDSRWMFPRERNSNLALLASAGIAWLLVALLFTTRSPVGNVTVQLLGAGLLGLAVALTAAPLLWLIGFAATGRIAYRGSWWRAARRAGWFGLVVTLFVVLRVQQAFSVPVALFIVVMVLVVEITLSVRR